MATEINIPLPMDAFARIISQLPSDVLIELRRQIDQHLRSRRGTDLSALRAAVEDHEFWESELGQMIMAEADDRLTLEELRQSLASIKGSLADDVASERDER